MNPANAQLSFAYIPFGAKPDYDPNLAVGCDGLPPAKLCLSHWPGNTTPPDLNHDLSTGSALAFARMGKEKRMQRFGPLETVANDHFDTDGLLAIFSCIHSEAALAREELLLASARAGDFWCFPSRRAAALDMAVSAMSDPERSAIGRELQKLDANERTARSFQYLLERFPRGIDDPWSLQIEIDDELSKCESDLYELRAGGAHIERFPELDLTIVNTKKRFDSRAVIEIAASDRILEMVDNGGGVFVNFQLTTRSWFDAPSKRALPRPNLAKLADRLQQIEKFEGKWAPTPNDVPFASLAIEPPGNAGFREQRTMNLATSTDSKTIQNTIITFLREGGR
ncbi:MAG: DUF6687 family protein [Planctomycetota bacterium]